MIKNVTFKYLHPFVMPISCHMETFSWNCCGRVHDWFGWDRLQKPNATATVAPLCEYVCVCVSSWDLVYLTDPTSDSAQWLQQGSNMSGMYITVTYTSLILPYIQRETVVKFWAYIVQQLLFKCKCEWLQNASPTVKHCLQWPWYLNNRRCNRQTICRYQVCCEWLKLKV